MWVAAFDTAVKNGDVIVRTAKGTLVAVIYAATTPKETMRRAEVLLNADPDAMGDIRMRNFSKRTGDETWTPISEPPPNGVEVTVTHAGDAFGTQTSAKLIDGEWECAVAFITNGGATLDFNPTHWRAA